MAPTLALCNMHTMGSPALGDGSARRYVRLKRHKTTVFMHCEPADTFASVKEKAGKLMAIEPGQMGLFATRDKVRACGLCATPQCVQCNAES